MNTIQDAIQEIYRRLPKLNTPEAEAAWTRLQGFERMMHEGIGWRGKPCVSLRILAAMLCGAKEYLHGLEEATGIIDKGEEIDHHYMIIMLLFASVRTDLAANLLVDEADLTNEDKENFKLQWRNLGFPIEIREKLRRVIRGA